MPRAWHEKVANSLFLFSSGSDLHNFGKVFFFKSWLRPKKTALHNWSRLRSKKVPESTNNTPKMLPKSLPRPPKAPPRAPKELPKSSTEGPRSPPKLPTWPPKRPRGVQGVSEASFGWYFGSILTSKLRSRSSFWPKLGSNSHSWRLGAHSDYFLRWNLQVGSLNVLFYLLSALSPFLCSLFALLTSLLSSLFVVLPSLLRSKVVPHVASTSNKEREREREREEK